MLLGFVPHPNLRTENLEVFIENFKNIIFPIDSKHYLRRGK